MGLFERDGELDRLDLALAGARAGRGGGVLVTGAPGLGKTALLAEVRRRAAGQGFRVLAALGGELEQDLPFALVRQLLEPALRGSGPEALSGAAALAGPVFTGGDTLAEVGSVVHGLYWLCSDLAETAPLLLAVDDVHWSDGASLRFLSHLVRRLADLPVVLLLGARPQPPGSALARVLTGAELVLALAPLSPAGVGHVVREAWPGAEEEFCAAVARASGGNPFLLTAAVSALRADGVAPVAAEADRVARVNAEPIGQAVLSRLARLGPAATRLARALAVLGSADLRRVAALAGVDQGEATDLVDVLAREGVLTGGTPLEFTHPLVRTAVYAEGTDTRRAEDHRRAAELLSGEDAPVESLVPHLLVAAPSGDAAVVRTLRAAAGKALSRGAPEVAASCLRRALAEPPVTVERPRLHAELGRALGMANRPVEAAQVLHTALELTEDPVLRGELALDLGGFMVQTGRPSAALETFEVARAALAEGELPLRLTVAYAMASFVSMEPPASLIARLEGLASTVDSTSPAGRMLLACLAFGACATGDRSAEVVGDLAARAVDGPLPDRDVWILANFASTALVMADRLPEALVVLDRGIEHARSRGNLSEFRYLAVLRSRTAFTAGHLLDAEADGRAALALHEVDGDRELPLAAAVLVEALAEQGQHEQAQEVLTAHDLDTEREVRMLIGHFVHMARGRLRLRQHRPEAALGDLLACGEGLVRAGCVNPGFAHWRSDAALAHHALGQTERARALVAEELALARRFGAPRSIGIALRTQGLVEGGPAGLAHLAESVAVLRESSGQLELGYSLVEYGSALRRAGQRTQAQHHLRQGLDLAAKHSAQPVVARAREELVASGARPRRAESTGARALTASELRVARLAAGGATNRELAQTLFVSRRTIEVHLTSVYRKLGITSRGQLARRLDDTA
ncbi:DNA-binding CsgD family transcriptional regulator [Crossiella equi]|uniref:DNA-binding CsgD family transcriptional regulator n=1 Tax=Crossiella equi TaxID=130796 RepID=A0ABS5AQD3_9PSEU|nr:LuxR family transcriptional regulator [Crossiella equi]MBP2478778.1 DNA-binding CsgD family transcriptional regulator [Crossiella equi]